MIPSKHHTNELPASAQTALYDGSAVATAFAKEKKEAWKQELSFPSGKVSKPTAQPQIPFHLYLISWAKLTISNEPRPHGRPTMVEAGTEAETSPVEIDFSRTVYKVPVHISKATLLFPTWFMNKGFNKDPSYLQKCCLPKEQWLVHTWVWDPRSYFCMLSLT